MSFAPLWELYEKFGQQLVVRLQQDVVEMAESAQALSPEQLHRFLAIINCYVNLVRSMAKGAPQALTIPGKSLAAFLRPLTQLVCCLDQRDLVSHFQRHGSARHARKNLHTGRATMLDSSSAGLRA